MYRLDLHTHSTTSPDGGIKPEEYQDVLESEILNFIAVTDHNRIDMAMLLKRELGNKIIVGEEIMTRAGEIIGLFLEGVVKPNLSPLATVQAIKEQGGLVYIPHPFETLRRGLTKSALNEIVGFVDIVEVHNGRAVFQNKGPEAAAWATLNHCHRAVSSDAHGLRGLGSNYTLIDKPPTKNNLLDLLDKARLQMTRPPLRSLLSPKVNHLRKRLHF